jgi:hypothetical protein
MQHIENKTLSPLKSIVLKCLASGLNALKNGQKEYSANAIEIYTHDIFSRVSEIDNIFKGLKISLSYIKQTELIISDFDFSDLHSFHVENFYLRLTSISDRCIKLAGTTILIDKNRIERYDGNKIVKKALKEYSDEINNSIREVESIIRKFRDKRNDIAHCSGYSTKNICALQTIENSNASEKEIFEKIIPVSGLKSIISDESSVVFEQTIESLNHAVSGLIYNLSSIYLSVIKTGT